MKYIASCSFGKNSIAMLIKIKELGLPLDGVIYCEVMFDENTSGEHPLMVEWIPKARKILKDRFDIEVKTVRADKSYKEFFYSVYQKGKNKGRIMGFPFLIGAWCNSRLKTQAINKYTKNHYNYIGYAIDEQKEERQKKIQAYLAGNSAKRFIYPLVDLKMTENECAELCKQYDLLSPLYKFSERGGCWFCHNQRLNELRALRREYPRLWEELIKLDKDSPVTFKPRGVTIKDLDLRFKKEEQDNK